MLLVVGGLRQLVDVALVSTIRVGLAHLRDHVLVQIALAQGVRLVVVHLNAVVLGVVNHVRIRLLDQMLLQLQRRVAITEVLRGSHLHRAGSLG